ncbi:hypothetical protein JY651_13915 [Pyxidicoccus parkwayensis]|uniref:Uncharacterized protein n=1 Tax=Pyxidicoccus parkwayensis TaxID=2813578 RepID=A0ABX7P659_9BACT|nr:hypothetical protein [Pyxidicoccus parkwaysis]QSQ25954.1 hypothetical protein JY651_13915 [Pyxidicoccus parkwaysis]
MHDLDQTKLELEGVGSDIFETGQDSAIPELEFYGSDQPADSQELELATELLGVSSDQELDQFLDRIFSKAKTALSSAAGRKLGGYLKNIAKKTLPLAGHTVGGWFGGPAGAAVGGQLAGRASQLFGLELEGLTPQDQEFEVAKSFVRLASDAALNLGPQGSKATFDPVNAARNALVQSAQTHAPGILRAATNVVEQSIQTPELLQSGEALAGKQGGRWVRRGNAIILYGV